MFGMKGLHDEILAMEEIYQDQKLTDSAFVLRCQRLEEELRLQLVEFKAYLSTIEPN